LLTTNTLRAFEALGEPVANIFGKFHIFHIAYFVIHFEYAIDSLCACAMTCMYLALFFDCPRQTHLRSTFFVRLTRCISAVACISCRTIYS
jgi:hypothetical protein